MSEMLHRIVPARMMGLPSRYLFVTTQNDRPDRGFDDLPGYMRDVLAFCGVQRDEVLVINRNTIVERLHLVKQAATIGTYPEPGYCSALAAFSTPRLDKCYAEVERPAQIYVSRSAFSRIGSFLGEAFIEKYFENSGFYIFRPERFGVIEQMDFYRKAQTVIFSGGSACHGVELLGRAAMNSVAYIPRLPFQEDVFSRVFRQRSRKYLSANITSYVGSFLSSLFDGKPAVIRGVSIFDLNLTADWLRAMGLSSQDRMSRIRYFNAVRNDLKKYEGEVRGSIERNSISRFSLEIKIARTLAQGKFKQSDTAGIIDHPAERFKIRFLSDGDLHCIWKAIETVPTPVRDMLRFGILTLQPDAFVHALRWSALSADLSMWTIPADPRHDRAARDVPLSEPARAILTHMSREGGDSYVFGKKGNRTKSLKEAKADLDARISASASDAQPLPDWTWVDLRRTAAQRLEEEGYDRAAIRLALGFVKSVTQPTAQRFISPNEDVSQMFDAWSAILTAITTNTIVDRHLC